MAESKKLLELRKKIKSKKPKFIRQDAHKHSKLSKSWRRPKGLQSKMRLHKKGYRTSVSTGYSSPAEVRGLHSSGLKIVLVSSLKEMEKINPEEGVLISSKIVIKKKIEMIKKAKEKNIKILNKKDSEKWLAESESKIAKRKEDKKKKKESKEKKKKELEKKSSEKKKDELSEKLSDEEKKVKEKEEKDKV